MSLQKDALKGRVVNATHDMIRDPDWVTNLSITDELTRSPELTPVFLKALKPRLDHKSHRVGYLAMTLLSSVVENCPESRRYVADPEFLTFLIKTLPKSIRAPQRSHLFGGGPVNDIEQLAYCDAVLKAIKRWAVVYKDVPILAPFAAAQRDLSKELVQFPDMTDDDLRPPIDLVPASSLSVPTLRLALPAPGSLSTTVGQIAAEAAVCLVEVINACHNEQELAASDVAPSLVRTIRLKLREIAKELGKQAVGDASLVELIPLNEALLEVDDYYTAAVAGKVPIGSRVLAPATAASSTTGSVPKGLAPRPTPAPALAPRGGKAELYPAVAPVTLVRVPALPGGAHVGPGAAAAGAGTSSAGAGAVAGAGAGAVGGKGRKSPAVDPEFDPFAALASAPAPAPAPAAAVTAATATGAAGAPGKAAKDDDFDALFASLALQPPPQPSAATAAAAAPAPARAPAKAAAAGAPAQAKAPVRAQAQAQAPAPAPAEEYDEFFVFASSSAK